MSFDDKIILFLNGDYPRWVDDLMIVCSDRFVWLPLYAILAVCVVQKLGWKRGLVILAFCGMAIGLADWVCATAIRPYVGRVRPIHPDNPISSMLRNVNGVPRSFSFPSCHASNTIALATFMSLVFRKKRVIIGLYCWSALVCFSRLYMAAHYLTDILAGAFIGATIATGLYFAARGINRRYFAAVILLFSCGSASAETFKFEYAGEMNSIFDNREGKGLYTPAKTYFLTRLAPEVGFSVCEGVHRVMAGVVWTQPIGCEWDGKKVVPTVYYRYQKDHVSGSLGMFPRTQLIEQLPEYLVSDSTRYFQHNIRGAMVQYHDDRGFFEALCDWRGMQSETRREAFAIIAQGQWHKGLIQVGGHGMLNHLALAKDAPGQYVNDNIILNPYFGMDFMPIMNPSAKFKSLYFRVGPIASMTRDRHDMEWINSLGGRMELQAEWWRLKLRNVASFTNKPLFPLFDRHSILLNEGEPYYASKFYNRTELSGLLCSYRDIVSLTASLDFHVARREFMFYQRLILTVRI